MMTDTQTPVSRDEWEDALREFIAQPRPPVRADAQVRRVTRRKPQPRCVPAARPA